MRDKFLMISGSPFLSDHYRSLIGDIANVHNAMALPRGLIGDYSNTSGTNAVKNESTLMVKPIGIDKDTDNGFRSSFFFFSRQCGKQNTLLTLTSKNII